MLRFADTRSTPLFTLDDAFITLVSRYYATLRTAD